MTRQELFAAAKAAGISGYQTMTNAAIEAALAGGPPPADPPSALAADDVAAARARLGRRFRPQAFAQGHQGATP